MMKKILFLLLCLCTAAIQADVYNVKDYGAKADGKTIDSPAINRAIQEAAANGGGTVYLPAGNYACYSIRLASHVHPTGQPRPSADGTRHRDYSRLPFRYRWL